MINILAMPLEQFSHEVYVLSPDKINSGLQDHTVNMFSTLSSTHNLMLLIIFGSLIAGLLAVAFFLKSRPVFRQLGARIDKSSKWGLVIIRVAFGLSLILSAVNGALYGPELPLSSFPLEGAWWLAMLIAGLALVVGFEIRFFATVAGVMWLLALILKGPYLLTYVNYFGEALALTLMPVGALSIDKWRHRMIRPWPFAEHGPALARIMFAVSILYTAVMIKFMSTMLTLDVARDFGLSRYFPFDPLFIVLGAALIEVLVGTLFLLGFLQRFTAIIFMLVMILSVLFFKESVWPHVLIAAFGIALFMHKPDSWTVDAKMSSAGRIKKRRRV